MKLMEELLCVIPHRKLKMLEFLINKNEFLGWYQIVKKSRKNAVYVKKDLDSFISLGLVKSEKRTVKIGQYKARRSILHYKINEKHKLIKELMKSI